jgi:hypothetical protein
MTRTTTATSHHGNGAELLGGGGGEAVTEKETEGAYVPSEVVMAVEPALD